MTDDFVLDDRKIRGTIPGNGKLNDIFLKEDVARAVEELRKDLAINTPDLRNLPAIQMTEVMLSIVDHRFAFTKEVKK